MKLTLRNSALLFSIGVAVSLVCAIPAIINHDNRFLTLGLIISAILFLIAAIGFLKWIANRR